MLQILANNLSSSNANVDTDLSDLDVETDSSDQTRHIDHNNHNRYDADVSSDLAINEETEFSKIFSFVVVCFPM